MATRAEARAQLFEKFDKLKPGDKLVISKESNGRPDLYIELCKEYIDSGHPHYDFNSDYSKFRRMSHYF